MLLILPGFIWGAAFLFIAEGLDALAPDGVTFVRIAVGFATLSLIPAARQPIDRGDWGGTALLGALWLAFPLSMFPRAEQHVSSALTGMLNGATPLFTAAVASAVTRRAPSRGIGSGLAIGLTGVTVMAWPTIHTGSSGLVGVLLIVAALASCGVALNLARLLQQRNGALPVIWRALAVALLLTAPLGVSDLAVAHWTLRSVFSILMLGALGTGLAHLLVAVAAGRVGATRASATTFLIPPVALILGIVVRGEQVAGLAIGGCALCIAGAWLIRCDQAQR